MNADELHERGIGVRILTGDRSCYRTIVNDSLTLS
jgi:hypothetical protein